MSKKSYAIFVLSTLIVVSIAQSNVGYAVETPANTEEVLVFLRDVIQLDMTKYEVRLSTSAVNYWPWLGGLAQTTGQYVLDSTGFGGTSFLEVSFTFVDNDLVSCFLYVTQGPVLYSEQSATDLIDAAAGFLQRYQTFTRDSSLETMRNMLDGIDATKDVTKTVGNIKLEVSTDSYSTLFRWRYTYNGAVYTGLNVEFRNGAFFMFSDNRSYYTIGGTDVNVSRDEAVNIALKRVETYSYKYAGEEIADFSIVKDQIRAELRTRGKDNPLVLYPYWHVELPLDNVYPGFVTYILVTIWADTGEVIECYALGSGGGLSPDGSSTGPSTTEPSSPGGSTPDESQTGNSPESLPLMYLIAAVAAISVPIAIVAVILKKKHK